MAAQKQAMAAEGAYNYNLGRTALCVYQRW